MTDGLNHLPPAPTYALVISPCCIAKNHLSDDSVPKEHHNEDAKEFRERLLHESSCAVPYKLCIREKLLILVGGAYRWGEMLLVLDYLLVQV